MNVQMYANIKYAISKETTDSLHYIILIPKLNQDIQF